MRRDRTAIRRGQGRVRRAAALTLAAFALGAQGDARPRSFTVVNAGTAAIVAIEVSPTGQAQFGPSLIGRVELPPGNALHITMPARTACRGDLRIRWDSGRVEERAGEDFCQPQRVLRLSTPTP